MGINKPLDQVNSEKEKAPTIDYNAAAVRQIINDRIDFELEQTFPASDPPSYSRPGNDGLKPGKEDIKKAATKL